MPMPTRNEHHTPSAARDRNGDQRQPLRTRLSYKEPIEFLEALRPGGPWLLTAINPVPPGIETVTAQAHDDVRDFLDRHEGAWNIHYSVNPSKQPLRSKAKKQDIAAVEYMHADLDPRDDETPARAKQRYRQRLADLRRKDKVKLTPTAIIDSGNGLQALWHLKEPIPPERFAEAEQRILALTKYLGGDTGTQNIDRVLRLPGTTNLPSAAKKKRGRKECPAHLLTAFDGPSYRLENFPLPMQQKQTTATNSNNTGTVAKDIPPQLMKLIHDGVPEKQRSDQFFHVVKALQRRGWSIGATVALLAQYPNGIAAKYLEPVDRLHQEVERVHGKYIEDYGHNEPGRVLTTRSLDQFPRRPIEFLWSPFFPIGELTALYGDGDVGKSTITYDMAARVSSGAPWPQIGDEPAARAPLGSVLIMCHEDDTRSVIRGRVEDARGNLKRVHMLGYDVADDPTEFDPAERLSGAIPEIEALISERRKHGDQVKLLIINPITDFTGGKDSWSDDQVRSVSVLLQPTNSPWLALQSVA
jgi:hypothetical protein